MFNSWLIQAQGNCKKLTAFWKNSLRRFSQGHCFGKKNRNSFLLNSWDLCVPTAAGHFLPFIHLSFCLFSLLTVPHSQPRLVYWGGGEASSPPSEGRQSGRLSPSGGSRATARLSDSPVGTPSLSLLRRPERYRSTGFSNKNSPKDSEQVTQPTRNRGRLEGPLRCPFPLQCHCLPWF